MPVLPIGYNKLYETAKQTVTTCKMLEPNDSVMVGVSGGPDSVALLHFLLLLSSPFSLKLAVAHLNHCLRREESDNDAEFVASLARKLNLPFYVQKVDVAQYRKEKKLSMEEAARCVRYDFYQSVVTKNGYNRIALGHNYDDNAEQVLMNILRGSGPLGSSGIPPVRDHWIIRPLIQVTRFEIIKFLDQRGLKYRLDGSNLDPKYMRNSVRLHLIPLLKSSYNPKIIDALNRFGSIAKSEEEWTEKITDELFEKTVLKTEANGVTLSVSRINTVHLAAQRRIIRKAIERVKGDLRRIGFVHTKSVIRLVQKGPLDGRLDLPDCIKVRRKGDELVFSRGTMGTRNRHSEPGSVRIISFEYTIKRPQNIFIKEIDAYMKFSEMDIKDLPDLRRTGQRKAFFDKDCVNFPLVVRNFRPGDRFQPLGMKGRKKLKNFFIDMKLPGKDRIKCPLLLDRGEIIWVAGHRIADPVKITSSTRKVIKIQMSPDD